MSTATVNAFKAFVPSFRRSAASSISVMANSTTSLLFAGPGAESYREQSCKALGKCSKDTPRLDSSELDEALKALPAWHLNANIQTLTRSFTAKNFVAAIKFFDLVANLAEELGHHPDLHLTNYREVQIALSTHAIGGLSRFDVVLAAKIDALPVDYSPKWLQQQGKA